MMKKKQVIKIAWASITTIVIIMGLGYFLNRSMVDDEAYAAGNTDNSSSDKTIEDYFPEENYNGVAIMVEGKEVTSTATYGYSNYEAKEVNDLDTIFPVASLQKMMTATLVAKTVSDGQLTYDTPLSDFYPDIEGSSDITIRDLLDQTSGIKMDEIAPDKVLTTQEEQLDYVLETLESTGETGFNYTNANYSLLAGILSTVTGESYEELFTKEIIEPLNLSHTFFWDNVAEEEVAKAYNSSLLYGDYTESASDFSQSKELYSSLIGAGNVLMSANDLVTFLQALTDGTLITKEEFSNMVKTDNDYSGAFWQNGGLMQTNGSLGDYQSSVFLDDNGENIIVLISNGHELDSLSDLASSIYKSNFA